MRTLTVIAIALAGAAGFGAGVFTPAARADIQPLLRYLGVISCSSSTPCQEGKNASTGAGLEGISSKGQGVIGQTKFIGSLGNARAGVLGQDASTSGSHDAGVEGTSNLGDGVDGFVGAPSGLFHAPAGVTGDSKNGAGLRGLSANGDALFADSINGMAVDGFSGNAPGVNAVGGHVISASNALPALSVVSNGSGAPLVAACVSRDPCDTNSSVFFLDAAGNVSASGDLISAGFVEASGNVSAIGVEVGVTGPPPVGSVNITGQYQKNGSCVAGCTAATTTSPGRVAVTYAATVSQPTVEDFGEAQLVSGQTYVHLDPKFANVIDTQANYLVFITPEGDANVLYVTQKSADGFSVRESHAGRSALPFSYRIVARPFGSHEARLPMADVPALHRSRLIR